MPKCSEGYRSKQVDDFMVGISILDVAQAVHESDKGSTDALPGDERRESIACIRFYLENWDWGVNPSAVSAYDIAVYRLLKAAYDDAREKGL
jgi:hypothetical protein